MKTILIILFILFSLRAAAPDPEIICIFEDEPVRPYEHIWNAVCHIESSNNPKAVGDTHLKTFAYGIVQIRRSRLNDYYNRTGVMYSETEMFDPMKAKQVFMYYCSQYMPNDVERICREWNGGSNGMNYKSTENYYIRVKSLL